MIRNPFFYRAADAKIGNLTEERNFVSLFGTSSLDIIRNKRRYIWELPLILISAPGGGKSSLMRIFTPHALRFIQETSNIGKERKSLSEKLNELGAFKNGKPNVLGIWLRLSDEYRLFDEFKVNRQGLFSSLINCRIILKAINGICILRDIKFDRDLTKISITLKTDNLNLPNIKDSLRSINGDELYKIMADLESNLCELIDNPFWEGNPEVFSHSGLWSLNYLSNIEIKVHKDVIKLRPLIMLDDIHVLSHSQQKYLLELLMSRQIPVPFWVSARKQALGLEELLTCNLSNGVERGRDFEIIDLENKTYSADFRKRALEISKLRVQSVASQIGGSSQAFVDFISDEQEDIFLKNLDIRVVDEVKERILNIAGTEIGKFKRLIDEIESLDIETHDLCRRLRMLEILVHREINKPQMTLPFYEIESEIFQKHIIKKAIIYAAELFFANDYKLPYYFGANRLVTLSSFNINQFLRLAGALFDEIMMAIRLNRDGDSFISPNRQHEILKKCAKEFMKDIPIMVPNGNYVMRFVEVIGKMCYAETYRPTASYAPGVTGIALTMYEFEKLKKNKLQDENKYFSFYHMIESAVAYNILEAEPNVKCKGQEFLVLYLNRLLCIPFKLPLQKGGFREQKLNTIFHWLEKGYQKSSKELEQMELWL